MANGQIFISNSQINAFKCLANALWSWWKNELLRKADSLQATAIDFFDIDIYIYKWHEWTILHL